MEENIRLIQPRLYERPRDRELHAKVDRLVERMYTLFSREDIFHATVAGAPYISPPS